MTRLPSPREHLPAVQALAGRARAPAADQRDAPVRRAAAHPLDPGQRQVRRLLQQLPADGELPGHRRRHPARPSRRAPGHVAVPAAPARDRPARLRRPAERPGARPERDHLRPRCVHERGRQLHRAAVAGRPRHGAHGVAGAAARPAAAVDAAAQGVRHRHRRLDDRHRRVHGPGVPRDRARPPGSSLTGLLLLLLALGAGPTPWSFAGGVAMVLVIVASAAVGPGQPGRVVAVLPDLRVRTGPDQGLDQPGRREPAVLPLGRRHPAPAGLELGAGRRRATSIARPTRGSRTARSTACWSSGPGSGTDVALALAQGRQARRRGRDRPAARPDRPRLPPGGRLRRPAGHGRTSTTVGPS